MFPVGLVSFPLDSALIANMLRNLVFVSPYTLLVTSFLIVGFLSFKIFSAKMTTLLCGIVFGSLIGYVMYRLDKKGQQKQERKAFINYVESSSEVNAETQSEEKELTLSKIFKK